MNSKALSISILLPLLACSTDIIDHGNGNGGANGTNRDGGPNGTPRDGGPPGVDAGPVDSGQMGNQCAFAASLGYDMGLVGIGSRGVIDTVWTNEFPAMPCTVTDFTLSPASSDFAVLPSGLPSQAQMHFMPVTFTPSAPGAVTTELRAHTSDGRQFSTLIAAVGVPQELLSEQTVTFEVANTSTAPIYLMTEGASCDALDLGAPLGLGFQCGCECPPPPTPHGRVYQRIEPGASFDLVWDARTLVTTPYDEFCGPPALGNTAPRVHGAPQPAAAGAYTARVVFERSIPAGCIESAGELSCESFEPATETPPMVAELCPSTFEASVAFTLPATGDLTVPVAIGN